MSSNKEPHFFCRRALFLQGAQKHNREFLEKPDAVIRGESSTGYLPSLAALERITTSLESPKAILVLREPVARAFSHYCWRFRLGLERRSFMEAATIDGYGYDAEKPDGFGYMSYLEFSRYSEHVPRWIESFGADRVLLIRAESLRDDMVGQLALCSQFLNLPHNEVLAPIEANVTSQLGAKPGFLYTVAARFLPASFKRTQLYARGRGKVLTLSAAEPPVRMTSEEREFVSSELSDDIAFYEKVFQ
jgi:Sulfotransferase domain